MHCHICGVYGGCWHTLNMDSRAQEDYHRRMLMAQENAGLRDYRTNGRLEPTPFPPNFEQFVEDKKPDKKLLLLRRVP